MSVNEAIAFLKANGYRVSKPRKQRTTPALNAIGRPYSPQFDPNYRMKYRRNVIAELCRPMPKNTPYVQ